MNSALPRFPGLPPHVQTANFWIDESGSRGSMGKGFVLGAIKTRHSDLLLREVFAIRERHGHSQDEFKFSRIRPNNEHRYRDLVDLLADSDAQIHAMVVDCDVWDPFVGNEQWAAQAALVSRIIAAGLNGNEVATVFMDGIVTPPRVALGPLVKRQVNSSLRGSRLTSAVSLNSKSNDLLQLADLVAGSIRALRFDHLDVSTDTGRVKEAVALRLTSAFGMRGVSDGRGKRYCIRTATPAPRRRRA